MQSYDVIAILKMAAVSHVWFRLDEVQVVVCLILKFRLDRIYSFGDRVIVIFWHFGLKLPIHAYF